MSTLYLVIASGGEFDDAWKQNEVGSFDQQKAKDYARDATNDRQKRNEDLDSFDEVSSKWYEEKGPIPYGTRLPIPKWGAGHGVGEKDITPEMRAERSAIQAKNDAMDKEYHAICIKQQAELQQMREEFFVARGYDKDDNIIVASYMESHDVRFSIEELEVI